MTSSRCLAYYRVSGVPHIIPDTCVQGPLWRDCSGLTLASRVFHCFPFWGAPQDVHRRQTGHWWTLPGQLGILEVIAICLIMTAS